MPRIRTIKPDFFKSEDVSALPFRARLTWVGLWTHCDDHGRYKDSVRLIKGDVWSLDDVSLRDIAEDLAVLAAARRIVRYEVDGKRYLAVVNWHAHQAINRPGKPKHPAPPTALGSADPADWNHCTSGDCARPNQGARLAESSLSPHGILTEDSVNGSGPIPAGEVTSGSLRESSLSTHGGLTEDSRQERKGKEGKGRDAREDRDRPAPPDAPPGQSPPPPKCDDHINNPDPPPCGACADARKARQRYDRDQAAAAALAQSERARSQAAANRAAIDACRLCDETGYRGERLCHHDPDVDTRTRRGAAAARAALRSAQGAPE